VETWTNIIFQVPPMCTELNGFAQRLYIFCISGMFETILKKKRGIKEGFFGFETWVSSSSKRPALRPSIDRL